MSNELPVSWISTTVGEVYQIVGGGTPATGNPDYWGGNTPWITSADIEGVRQINVRKYVSEKGIAESTTNRVPEKTLLVVTRVGLGKIAIAEAPVCFSQDLQGLIQDPHLISPEFALYLLSYQLQFLKFEGQGTTISGVTKKQLKDLVFPLPPFNEQHRIVAKIEELFSELDKGIENLKTAREQLKVYRQALLKHAFEGKLTAQWRAANPDKLEPAAALLARIQAEREQRYRQQLQQWETAGGSKPKAPKPLPPLTSEELAELPELPEGWGWVTLAHIQSHDKYAVKAGPFGSALKKEFYVKDGYKIYGQEQVIRNDHEYGDYFIDEQKFEELSSCAVKPFDVLISLVGTIGKVLVLSERSKPGIINPRLVKISLNLGCYQANFFKAYFESGFLRSLYAKESQGTTMDILNLGMIQRLPYPWCSIAEQNQILSILDERFSEIDQLELTLATSLQQSEALRQSILKKAFSGQLVAQDANDEPASVLLERIKTERAAQADMVKPRKPKQAAAVPAPEKSNVIPFPVRLPNISVTDLHAGILARAYQHHENAPKYLACFGHVKAEKIAHLVEAHLGIDLEREPIKDAAGPNDYPHLMKVESRARKANWFDVKKKKDADGYVFSKKRSFDALLLKTMKALGERADEVDALINLLLPLNSRQSEIVATLYAAWNNLLLQGQTPDDEAIVQEARENWHASKLKIERDKFFRGLRWMREHGLVPAGRGRFVAKKS